MTVYRGVVRGNRVELTEPADLPDGTEVEVRVVSPSEKSPASAQDMDERAREDAFERRLLELGLISHIPSRDPDPPWLDRTPVDIDGPPLSQTIIEERR
jgi:hypothetical protein